MSYQVSFSLKEQCACVERVILCSWLAFGGWRRTGCFIPLQNQHARFHLHDMIAGRYRIQRACLDLLRSRTSCRWSADSRCCLSSCYVSKPFISPFLILDTKSVAQIFYSCQLGILYYMVLHRDWKEMNIFFSERQ